MSVTTRHPLISAERIAEWQLMRDAMDGESAIKTQGEVYLSKPSGFPSDAQGSKMYAAYKARAQFPEILAPSVAAMIGIVHGREIAIEMPTAMEFLWEDADGLGLPLEAFHRRITRELFVIGRYGVLTDAPEDGGNPFLVGYSTDSIINWDSNFWVLDESTQRRDGFIWKKLERYRVLNLETLAYAQHVYERSEATAMFAEIELPVLAMGGKALPRIPFVVGNARDLSPVVETPPLIGVARAALAIYQLSADYRHQLYMSGQETLVVINGEAPTAVGAGAVHELRGGEGVTPDMKYVSPSCTGIQAHLDAIEDNRLVAIQAGARMLEQAEGVEESGAARKLRFASETATMTSVAQASCVLLEKALRNVAMMMGLPEDAVIVTPPVDLLDRTMTPQDFAALFGVYQAGGMSWETLHEAGTRGGIYSPERDAAQEYQLIDSDQEVDETAI